MIESQNGSHEIFVKDNGIGIDKSHHNKIFNLFEKAHNNFEFAGEGIGLAVVHKGIDLMNGLISVESKPGQGTTFFIKIPKKIS